MADNVAPLRPFGVINAEDQSGLIAIMTALSMSFVLVSFAIRIYVRHPTGLWKLDDNVLTAATVLSCIQSAVVFFEVHIGLGKTTIMMHRKQNATLLCIYHFANNYLYLLTSLCSKLSIGFLYLRLSRLKEHHVATWIVQGFCAAWFTLSILLLSIGISWQDAFQLGFWRWLVIGVTDGLTDILLVSMSLLLVKDLRMSPLDKGTVVFAFAMRLLTLPAISIRLYYIWPNSLLSNRTLATSLAITCTQLELGYGIMAASITVLKPFMVVYEKPLTKQPANTADAYYTHQSGMSTTKYGSMASHRTKPGSIAASNIKLGSMASTNNQKFGSVTSARNAIKFGSINSNNFKLGSFTSPHRQQLRGSTNPLVPPPIPSLLPVTPPSPQTGSGALPTSSHSTTSSKTQTNTPPANINLSVPQKVAQPHKRTPSDRTWDDLLNDDDTDTDFNHTVINHEPYISQTSQLNYSYPNTHGYAHQHYPDQYDHQHHTLTPMKEEVEIEDEPEPEPKRPPPTALSPKFPTTPTRPILNRPIPSSQLIPSDPTATTASSQTIPSSSSPSPDEEDDYSDMTLSPENENYCRNPRQSRLVIERRRDWSIQYVEAADVLAMAGRSLSPGQYGGVPPPGFF